MVPSVQENQKRQWVDSPEAKRANTSNNSCHMFTYWTWVEDALTFTTVLQTVSVQLVSSWLDPAGARPIAVGSEGPNAKSRPLNGTGDPFIHGGAVVS